MIHQLKQFKQIKINTNVQDGAESGPHMQYLRHEACSANSSKRICTNLLVQEQDDFHHSAEANQLMDFGGFTNTKK